MPSPMTHPYVFDMTLLYQNYICAVCISELCLYCVCAHLLLFISSFCNNTHHPALPLLLYTTSAVQKTVTCIIVNIELHHQVLVTTLSTTGGACATIRKCSYNAYPAQHSCKFAALCNHIRNVTRKCGERCWSLDLDREQ